MRKSIGMHRRSQVAFAIVALGIGFGVAPAEARVFWTSLAGAAAMMSILLGLRSEHSISIVPWLFVAVAAVLGTAGGSGSFGDGASAALHLVAIGSLSGAGVAAHRQTLGASIHEASEARKPQYRHRGRVGAAWVAVGVAVSLAGLHFAAPQDSRLPIAESVAASGKAQFARAPYAPLRVVGRLEHPGLVESSGVVSSRSNPGVVWTHNDSGHAAVLYCSVEGGRSCGRWHVPGAAAFDWEAIAISGDASSTIFIGDIGDNATARSHVTVYAVPEPQQVTPSKSDRAFTTEPARAIDLSFPDGPADAESLMVHPATGDLYVIAKEGGTRAPVYAARAPLHSTEKLVRVGTLDVPAHLSEPTGGDISPSGLKVVFSTYGGIYELELEPGRGFDSIWNDDPRRLTGLGWGQFEGVAYSHDGGSIFVTEEGRAPRVWAARGLNR